MRNSLTSDDIEGITKVGDVIKPSLERILKLKPDFILGMYFHEQIYKQLSEIAPTILVKEQKYEPIKKNLQYLAHIFNKEVEAEKVLSQYQDRIIKLRNELTRQPQEIEVTVLIFYSGNFYLPGTWHASHEIFSDIGLIDNLSETFSPISIEILDGYDADILFIMD
jgi:iron complex transport system substrate-binding protein